MKIVLLNLPWLETKAPLLWGVRAGSRWPHFQQRPTPNQLPRYIPFPFLMAIAAAQIQQDGHKVLLIDGVAEGCSEASVLERVRNFCPDLIFVETSTPSLRNDLSLISQLKVESPSAVFACGGVHAPGLVPELLETHATIKWWLAGEYDTTLPALINQWAAEKSTDQIPGLIYAGSSPTAPHANADLSTLCSPLYEQLPMKNYSDPVCGLPAPSAQTWISRGCPFGCTFCVWPQVLYGNRKHRTRDIHLALDEVEKLIDSHGCESFYFDDDTTNIGNERMRELAAAIKERGLDAYPWSMMARADCMEPATIDALADAGLYSIKYGVESISPRLINACDKATNLQRFHEAVSHTAHAHIKQHLTFTFGIPGETAETIRESLGYCMAVAPESAQFSLCTPFPGTVFYDECKSNGWLTTEDWSQFLGSSKAVVNTPWLPAEELQHACANAIQQWNTFCANRLEQRKHRLLKKLIALSGSFQWCFQGDHDFADFIFSCDNDTVFRQQAETIQPGVIPVIVSRHDEEKIYRRLLRDEKLQQRNLVLRLYS